MSEPWIVAVISLWVLLTVVAVGTLALARQVGLLHLRVKPLGPGRVEDGPAVDDVVVVSEVSSLRSKRVAVVLEKHIGVIVFVSPSCGLCKPVLDGVARLRRVESDLLVTVAVDDDGQVGLEYLEKHGFRDGVAATELDTLDSGSRPYAVAVDGERVVLAAGAVNNLDQFEALIDMARDRARNRAVGVADTDDDWTVEPIGSNGSGGAELEALAPAAPVTREPSGSARRRE